MSRKRQKINNTEEMMDVRVENYFRYDELGQMEAEAIRYNITGSDTEVLEYREYLTRCLGLLGSLSLT
jgi:hypothetical protein